MAKRGPSTLAGRQRAALNALTHGILARAPVIPGVETEEEWHRHLEGITESLAPATPMEALLVDRIAVTTWRLKRIEVHETELLAIAQATAEERAAAQILNPAGGAVSLHGTSAAALIQDRIDALHRLSDLLLRFQDRRPGWAAPISHQDMQLLFEGLNLALQSAAPGAEDLSRQVIRELTEDDDPEADKAMNLARNVRRLVADLETLADDTPEDAPAASPRTEATLAPPKVAEFVGRYPVALVLIRLQPELRRLEAGLLDLDATIARIQRQSLILADADLAPVIRYEAHLRRQFIQYHHELEALQAKRGGQPAPLARLDVQMT